MPASDAGVRLKFKHLVGAEFPDAERQRGTLFNALIAGRATGIGLNGAQRQAWYGWNGGEIGLQAGQGKQKEAETDGQQARGRRPLVMHLLPHRLAGRLPDLRSGYGCALGHGWDQIAKKGAPRRFRDGTPCLFSGDGCFLPQYFEVDAKRLI